MYVPVGDLYRRIHGLQKVARHLGPDHFRFIMTASAPKAYTMRKLVVLSGVRLPPAFSGAGRQGD
jgi:hypothetical protein